MHLNSESRPGEMRGEDGGLLLASSALHKYSGKLGRDRKVWTGLSFKCLLHCVVPSFNFKFELSALPVIQHNSLGWHLVFCESPLGEH